MGRRVAVRAKTWAESIPEGLGASGAPPGLQNRKKSTKNVTFRIFAPQGKWRRDGSAAAVRCGAALQLSLHWF